MNEGFMLMAQGFRDRTTFQGSPQVVQVVLCRIGLLSESSPQVVLWAKPLILLGLMDYFSSSPKVVLGLCGLYLRGLLCARLQKRNAHSTLPEAGQEGLERFWKNFWQGSLWPGDCRAARPPFAGGL